MGNSNVSFYNDPGLERAVDLVATDISMNPTNSVFAINLGVNTGDAARAQTIQRALISVCQSFGVAADTETVQRLFFIVAAELSDQLV